MQSLPPVLYRGSVKNVRGEVYAKNLMFEFSDRYSVFDWGEMPDQLDEKGKTLAIMGKSFFQFLEKPENWKTLFSSLKLNESFSEEYLRSLENSEMYKTFCRKGISHHAIFDEDYHSPTLNVKNITIVKPDFDGRQYHYEKFSEKPVDTLVPLEVIFRLGLPPGNSLSKRLGKSDFGMLEVPVIDFSTKLERGDRYIDYTEAQTISGMNDTEFSDLKVMTHLIALNLFKFHSELGLELWDGKIEVAFTEGVDGNRSFMLVDSIGIDELRLLYNGKSFSKEFLRESYKDGQWYESLEASKKESLETGVDFKVICTDKYKSTPQKLDPKIKERAEAVYKSYCNAVSEKVLGKQFFDNNYTLKNYSSRYL